MQLKVPFLVGVLVLLSTTGIYAQSIQVNELICEYAKNPVGISVKDPVRLGWQLSSSGSNIKQSAYEIRVAFSPAALKQGKNLQWQTGRVVSDQSVHVIYKGNALVSRQPYYWQVRIWDDKGRVTPWSAVNSWETGLLQQDWSASWITSATTDTTAGPAPMFRKQFELKKKVRSARAYITSHGIYEAYLNGKRVGDGYFTPGWTSYNIRLQYQVYDVTALLNTGANAAGVMIGDGWYRGYTYRFKKDIYGKDLALLFQLELLYEDGSKETVVSDNSWKSAYGPIRSSEFFNGEVYDARMERTGWMKAGYNDQEWKNVTIKPGNNDNLIATNAPLVKKQEIFRPLSYIRTPKGETVVDFGQNLVGWVQFRIKGSKGDTVKLTHAEVLDEKGNFYMDNIRSAKQEIKYVVKGEGNEQFEPHFTFQGFRYVKIEGPLDTTDLKAFALYSDMGETGTFTTSHPLVNQLQHNIQWGQKGNFVDIPTDCPQRDERLGWTGDAQAFSRTATFNMNVATFYEKWLKDLAVEQKPDGAVPYVIPNVLRPKDNAAAGWSDVATIAPWHMYLAYGDTAILRNQYKSMKAWVNYIRGQAVDNLWNNGDHFGDWLFYTPGDADDDGRAAITNKHLIAQTFYAHSTQLLINTANILGLKEDAATYTALLKKIKDAFVMEYVTRNGSLVSGSQTAYVLTLHFDMLPEELRQQAAKRLVQNIKDYGDHLTTGFLGTPNLCHVLTRFGYNDIAYMLLMQETYPSWLYPVKKGATTIWERWDGIRPNGTLQQANMNSFNHYAYGAIGDWMYRVIAGIGPIDATPGYKRIRIAPQPGGNLTYASASLKTLYGLASSSWKLEGNIFKLDVTVPHNTTADVTLPGPNGRQLTVGSGVHHFEYRM